MIAMLLAKGLESRTVAGMACDDDVSDAEWYLIIGRLYPSTGFLADDLF